MGVNGLALCSGVAGLELGLRIALGRDYRTICHVEREAYAASVLVARMEDETLEQAPVWDDLETFDGECFRGIVDIVSAGFPCQPHSTAPRGRNRKDCLWPHVERVVRECEPAYVFVENVPTAPWGDVRTGLGGLGFDCTSGTFCPSDLGAPCRRPRVFLLATHPDRQGEPWSTIDAEVASVQEVAANDWTADPGIIRMDDGPPYRVDRLRAIGNAVVPMVAAHAFRKLIIGT